MGRPHGPLSLARRIARAFAPRGRLREVRPFGRGLINDTFLVVLDRGGSFVLQRLNRGVFPRPEWVMDNLRLVLDQVRRSGATGGPTLPGLLTTAEGADQVVDREGGLWRAMELIERARSLERVATAGEAAEIGRALGRFHVLVDGLDPGRLHVTLPGFHVTPGYLRCYDRVTAAPGRGGEALQLCRDFVEARRGLAPVLEEARAAGRLRLRVTHGDPKLDNVLFDPASGRAVGLIDLDTVQPGLLQHDLADCLRSCCNRAGESPADPLDARFDLGVCRALLAGYTEPAAGLLGEEDFACLYDAIRILPLELGIRFLTDHLQGNRYFRVEDPEQNLRRALTQFALVRSIESQETRLRGLIAEVRRAG